MRPAVPGACPMDLLARARRAPLLAAEQQQLAAHLRACATCRVDRQLGDDFDRLVRVLPGDEALAAKVVAATFAAAPPRAAATRRRAAAAASAALVFAAAAAVAAGAVWRARRGSGLPPHAPAPRAATVAAAPPPPAPRGVAADAGAPEPALGAQARAVVAAPRPPAAATARSAPRRGERPAASGSRGADGGAASSAAELFRAATDARRRGDAPAAIVLLRELERRHPASAEASMSRVVLGRLLADSQHEPAAALEQFDRYLGAAAAGPLAEEALYRRAGVLMRLGRARDERQTWERLLEAFPRSVYAARARERLRQIP